MCPHSPKPRKGSDSSYRSKKVITQCSVSSCKVQSRKRLHVQEQRCARPRSIWHSGHDPGGSIPTIGSKSRYLNDRKAKPMTTDGYTSLGKQYLTPRNKFPPYYSYVIHIIVQIHVPHRTETACSTCQVVSSL